MKPTAIKITVIFVIMIMALYSWSLCTAYETADCINSFLPPQNNASEKNQEILNSEAEVGYFDIHNDSKEHNGFLLRFLKRMFSGNLFFLGNTNLNTTFSDYSVLIFSFLLMQFHIIKVVHLKNTL